MLTAEELENAVRYFLEFLKGFETLTLMQTDVIEQFPVVLMGSDFWLHVRTFIAETLLVEKTIEAEDAELFYVMDSPEEVVSIIKATDQETEPA